MYHSTSSLTIPWLMVVYFQVSWAASFPEYLRCPFCGCICINSSPSGDPFFPILGPAQDDISQSPAQALGINGEWWRLDLHGPQAAPKLAASVWCHPKSLIQKSLPWKPAFLFVFVLGSHHYFIIATWEEWQAHLWRMSHRACDWATSGPQQTAGGWEWGSPTAPLGGPCPHHPIIVSHKALCLMPWVLRALTAPQVSSPCWLTSPSLVPTPQPWLLCTVGSWSCGEPGRVPEVTWFSQLTGFLDCMFCRSTFLSL